MRPPCPYLTVLGLFLLALSCTCCKGPRLIPEARMSAIYADMFMADQWIRENQMAKAVADTSLFYEPVFKRHGYSFEDYDYSLNYYLDHPDKFIKLLSVTTDYLKVKQEETQKLSDEIDRVNIANSMFRGYESVDFDADSLRWRDTLVLWPSIPADSVTLAANDTVVATEDKVISKDLSEKEENVEGRNSVWSDQEQAIRKLSGD